MMRQSIDHGRSLAIVLATAFVGAGCGAAFSQAVPLAERIVQCGGCHGEDGNSKLDKVPSLAGQPEFFIVNQLFLMREGVRKVEAMVPFVKDLKDDDLVGLAKHYAGQGPKASGEPLDPALVKRGEELAAAKRCNSCHGADFGGQDQVPRLAKQRVDFLVDALTSFRDNPRDGADTVMSASVSGVSDPDLVALAHYAASR